MTQLEILNNLYQELIEEALSSSMEHKYCELMEYCKEHSGDISDNMTDELFKKAEDLEMYAFFAGALSILQAIPQSSYFVVSQKFQLNE